MDTQTHTHDPLPRAFEDRDALAAFLKATFPEAGERDDRIAPTHGGRRAAEKRLDAVDPAPYG
ncbi:MAG: hypothetical protein ACFB6R_15120, partial [Alphaproteobacteria bacterium]